MTATHSAESPDRLLDTYPPPVRVLTNELRLLLRSAAPDATERTNLGWRSLNWSHPRAGYFCGLFPQSNHVRVVFEFGVLLDDPDGLLAGTETQARWVSVAKVTPLVEANMRRMIADALALPVTRAERLALLEARRTAR